MLTTGLELTGWNTAVFPRHLHSEMILDVNYRSPETKEFTIQSATRSQMIIDERHPAHSPVKTIHISFLTLPSTCIDLGITPPEVKDRWTQECSIPYFLPYLSCSPLQRCSSCANARARN